MQKIIQISTVMSKSRTLKIILNSKIHAINEPTIHDLLHVKTNYRKNLKTQMITHIIQGKICEKVIYMDN